jgi:hypothetical protein
MDMDMIRDSLTPKTSESLLPFAMHTLGVSGLEPDGPWLIGSTEGVTLGDRHLRSKRRKGCGLWRIQV